MSRLRIGWNGMWAEKKAERALRANVHNMFIEVARAFAIGGWCMSRAFDLVVLMLIFGMLFFGCAGQKGAGAPAVSAPTVGAAAGVNCTSYSSEACPSSCVVCPPCEACSSFSCQTEQSCKSIGFDKSWYEGIKQNLAAHNTSAASSGAGNVYVIHAPQYATLGGKNVLFYEIYLANRAPAGLYKLEVLDGERVLKTVEGAELNKSLRKPQLGVSDCAIYMWVNLNASDKPSSISHKLYFADGALEGARTDISYAPPIVISPPVYGDRWVAVEGPDNFNHHRRAIIPLMGKVYVPERFAIDWVRLGSNGLIYSGNGSEVEDYFDYGQEIHAVADGEIVDTKEGIPDNVPFDIPAVSVGWAAGNLVTQQIGNGTYAYYVHMIPGSVRVKIGDKVKRGDVLGLLGNSGISGAPHLHFHIGDTKDPLFTNGLPYVFETYEWGGNANGNIEEQFFAPYNGSFSSPVRVAGTSMPGYNDVVTLGLQRTAP